MISNILRKLSSFLSFYYFNQKVSCEKDLKIRKIILNKIKKINLNKINLKKTHLEFNNQILNLLQSENLKNFLRENFIQKMFFVQNRLFIFNELKELKISKNWNFYQKIIKEDYVGNPIRYFLYPKSSGNKINHVFHLHTLFNELNIHLKKDIKKIFEFGAGYGCMARIYSKINPKIKYTCFDTDYVNLLQYYFLKSNNLNVGFTRLNRFYLTSNINKINNNYDLFIANWSLSEVPLNFRKKIIPTILKSKYILISFQENFEDINNLKYFYKLKSNLSKKFRISIIKNKYYKGNFLFKQTHFFLIGKKK